MTLEEFNKIDWKTNKKGNLYAELPTPEGNIIATVYYSPKQGGWNYCWIPLPNNDKKPDWKHGDCHHLAQDQAKMHLWTYKINKKMWG